MVQYSTQFIIENNYWIMCKKNTSTLTSHLNIELDAQNILNKYYFTYYCY